MPERLDPDFEWKAAQLLTRSPSFLKECAPFLEATDFKEPIPREIAGVALDYWRSTGDPAKRLIRTLLRDAAENGRYSDEKTTKLLNEATRMLKGPAPSSEWSVKRVLDFKRLTAKRDAIVQLAELDTSGALTDREWTTITQKALLDHSLLGNEAVDYYAGVKERIRRRRLASRKVRLPAYGIEPLDKWLKGVGRGHLACVMGFAGFGKSTFLRWISWSLAVQGWNVLYCTLEDPLTDVEDAFDALHSRMKRTEIEEDDDDQSKKFWQRWKERSKYASGRILIKDYSQTSVTVDDLDHEIAEQERRGFDVDALIVDYDQEITPKKMREDDRRFQFEQIYTDLGRLARRRSVLVWTAAQTNRKAEEASKLHARDLAEDINKVRKVTLMLALGKSKLQWEVEEDGKTQVLEGIHLHVVKHRNDRHGIEFDMIPDRERSLIYDPYLTQKAVIASRADKEEEA